MSYCHGKYSLGITEIKWVLFKTRWSRKLTKSIRHHQRNVGDPSNFTDCERWILVILIFFLMPIPVIAEWQWNRMKKENHVWFNWDVPIELKMFNQVSAAAAAGKFNCHARERSSIRWICLFYDSAEASWLPIDRMKILPFSYPFT